jgi:TolB protein
MPDVQELFRESTHATRPETGALQRQHERQRRSSRSRKVGTIALVAAMLSILVAAFVVARPPVRDGKRPADTSPTIGPRIFAVDVDDGTLTSIPELGWDSWSFVYSPDGSQVAYVGSSAGSRQLFLMTADSTVPQQLTHDAFAAEDPTWSPDGSSIAYTGFDRSGTRQIFVIGADGGTARMVTKEPHDARNPSWSPPGAPIPGTRLVGCRANRATWDSCGPSTRRPE